jgi:hypothetical protein
LIIFGSQIVGPFSQLIAQLSNNAIIINPRTLLPLLILGLVVLSVISSVVRALFNAPRRNDTYAPTTIAPPSLPSSPQRPGTPSASTRREPVWPSTPSLPSGMERSRLGGDMGSQQLPQAPKFEPIVDPKILSFGILGLLVLGGFLFVVFLLSGPLP